MKVVYNIVETKERMPDVAGKYIVKTKTLLGTNTFEARFSGKSFDVSGQVVTHWFEGTDEKSFDEMERIQDGLIKLKEAEDDAEKIKDEERYIDLINRLKKCSEINHPDRLWSAAFYDNVVFMWRDKRASLIKKVLQLEDEIKRRS